jgi:imidazolonepropionase-like amidohydrolase
MRLVLAAAAIAVALTGAAHADVALVRANHVLVDAAQPPLGPSTVVVRDGRIVAVVSGAPEASTVVRDLRPGEPVRVHDLGDRWLLPGLIDSHVHLTSDAASTAQFWRVTVTSSEYMTLVGVHNARLTVEAGFTTVRDLGAPPDVGQALREGVRNGFFPGPRIQTAGTAISIVGGHGDEGNGFNSEVGELLSEHAGNTCTGAAECAARVRQLSRAGVDLIKITATGGVLSQTARGLAMQFSQDEMNAIVQTAHSLGLKVAAHAHGADAIRGASLAGVDSIEHGTFIDEDAARAMRRAGAYLVPTYMPARQYQERLAQGPGFYTPVVEAKIRERLAALGRNVRMARRFGVPIAFGTDAGVFAHGRNGEEFAMLVEHAGMTPRETLVAATTNAARLLGLQNEIGALRAGYAADLIAVGADPFADVRTLERVSFVMANGRVVKDAR